MTIDSFYSSATSLVGLVQGVFVDYSIDSYPFQSASGSCGILITTRIEDSLLYVVRYYHTDISNRLIDYNMNGKPSVLFDLEWEWCDNELNVLLDGKSLYVDCMTRNKFTCITDNINPYDYEVWPTDDGHQELVFRGPEKYNLFNLKIR